MTKEEYIRRFDKAAQLCREFAQHYLVESLPTNIRFDIPFGLNGDETGKVKFLGGRLVYPQELRSMEYIKARKYLWIDGRVPLWVNMQVTRTEPDATIIEINLSRDLIKDESKLFHSWEGNPPFHVLGPLLPRGWRSLAENGKFSLTTSQTGRIGAWLRWLVH